MYIKAVNGFITVTMVEDTKDIGNGFTVTTQKASDGTAVAGIVTSLSSHVDGNQVKEGDTIFFMEKDAYAIPTDSDVRLLAVPVGTVLAVVADTES